MRFGILGPLSVTEGGRTFELTSSKSRAVLAVLLRHANTPVSDDLLADALWGDRPPRSAAANLRMYVHTLRRTLESADRIARVPPGYALTVRPGELDAQRFADLVRQGREAGERADAVAAHAALSEALGLWRGDAYAGLDDLPSLRDEAVRLEELRLAAVEDRVSAGLDLGRHGELVPELRALAAEHPLRERFRAQLMLALYRSGRQAEALQVYRDTRRVLTEELGIEPGPRLRRLEEAVLANDPSLDLAAPVRAVPPPGQPAWPAPQQLPPGVAGFTGRAEELARLTGLVPEEGACPSTVVIASMSGMAGVGKTTLAVHWAHRLRDRFPDGTLFVDLRGYGRTGPPARPDEVLDGFLRALHVPPAAIPPALEERAAMYRSRLDRRRMLIVLDNAASSEQVGPLLPGTGDCMAVVTSRGSMSGLVVRTGAHRIPVGLLSREESLALLREVMGAGRVDAEPEASAEVARLCAYLPLALRLAAERAAVRPHLSPAELCRELQDERGRLDLLAAADDDSVAVRAAFRWSYRALPPDAARTFRLLGLHPGPDISLDAAAVLTAQERRRAREQLEALTDVHLLQETTHGRYRLHDLLRVYARDRAAADEPEPERDAAVRRVLGWYLSTADAADRVLMPGRRRVPMDPPPPECRPAALGSAAEALEWCEAERLNLVAATRHAAEAGMHDVAWKLPFTLWSYFSLRTRWTDWIVTHDIGLGSVRESGDRYGEAHLLTSIANAYREVRRFDEAFERFAAAIAIGREIGEPWIEASARTLRSVALADLRRFDAAMDDCEGAEETFRAIGDRWGEAWVRYQLGEICGKVRRPAEGIEHSRRALALFERVDDHWGASRALWALGRAYRDLGRREEAEDHSRRALDAARAIGNRLGEGFALLDLGKIKEDAGDGAAARRLWRQALGIFEQLGAPQAERVRARLAASRPASRTDDLPLSP
ncbi:AfsR/SARP family transcriptional regulator [Actinomadura madurae]|uniref:AfsR/SARP family transcriptional regulator n=3 Tax=Actinomadura madurae TaxID=1993 RepID=UPI0024E20D74|nr:BTAD domain-containing putative transcriptional regulator [Actinomadura madurae]